MGQKPKYRKQFIEATSIDNFRLCIHVYGRHVRTHATWSLINENKDLIYIAHMEVVINKKFVTPAIFYRGSRENIKQT